MLHDALVQLLVDPQDRQPLRYIQDEDALYNERLHRLYKIHDEIPNLLVDAATQVDEAEHARLMQLPAVLTSTEGI